MAINTKKYIEQFLQIRTKSAEVVPLRLNAPQQKLYAALAAQARAGKPLRAIVLKALNRHLDKHIVAGAMK